MEFTCCDMSDIQEAIRRHLDRMAQLLDDVDALRRSAAELRISGLNGRAAVVLDLCTERIHAGDVALGHLAAHLADPTPSGKGRNGSRTDRMGRQAAGYS
jgi:hypothetical protein